MYLIDIYCTCDEARKLQPTGQARACSVFYDISYFTIAQICDHGDIRLEDGPTMFEGRVEVCLDGQWVTVCNDFWGSNEIAVVCRQLGFQVTGEKGGMSNQGHLMPHAVSSMIAYIFEFKKVSKLSST